MSKIKLKKCQLSLKTTHFPLYNDKDERADENLFSGVQISILKDKFSAVFQNSK